MSQEFIIVLSMAMFTGTVLVLVGFILAARSKLVSEGTVTIDINHDPEKRLEVPSGGKLLQCLAEEKLFCLLLVVVAVLVVNVKSRLSLVEAIFYRPKNRILPSVKFVKVGV